MLFKILVTVSLFVACLTTTAHAGAIHFTATDSLPSTGVDTAKKGKMRRPDAWPTVDRDEWKAHLSFSSQRIMKEAIKLGFHPAGIRCMLGLL